MLRGAGTHSARLQATAHGTTRALEHVVNSLEDTRAQFVDHLGTLRGRLADLRVQAEVPFEHAGRLAELAARQQELVGALDLSRQAGPVEAGSDTVEPAA